MLCVDFDGKVASEPWPGDGFWLVKVIAHDEEGTAILMHVLAAGDAGPQVAALRTGDQVAIAGTLAVSGRNEFRVTARRVLWSVPVQAA